jgi:hypothetical protein
LQNQAGYDRFEAYGFGVDYPSDCVIEFNPKSRRTEGDLAFKSPNGYMLYLSWGQLEKVKKLGGVEGHADYSVQKIKGRREAKVGDVRKDTVDANGHRSAFREVNVEMVRRGILSNPIKSPQQVRSLHIHCDVSGRYFVIYGPVGPEKSREQGETVSRMVKSLVCHR